jgi:uncharacterized membrane protein
MMISILGILDDITISQASVVQELKGAKENIDLVSCTKGRCRGVITSLQW